MSGAEVFCEQCGVSNASDWRFCSNCGTPLVASQGLDAGDESAPPLWSGSSWASPLAEPPTTELQRISTPPPTSTDRTQQFASAGDWQPQRRSAAPLLVALLAFILLCAIGAGLYLGGVFGHRDAARRRASTLTPPSTQTVVTVTAPTSAQTLPPVPQPTAADRATVLSALSTYVQAWRDGSPSELGSLLATNVLRIGSVNGRCTMTVGRANVVHLYATSEFTGSTANYRLLEMAPSVVEFTGLTAAKVLDFYSIAGSRPRFVNFTFVKLGKRWMISKIHAWCGK